ncbi:MAG: hypothetical protein MMC33_010624 [Icmadophila ericetorum]|nr:hypothetical protein [Icmadophila ericetorum]
MGAEISLIVDSLSPIESEEGMLDRLKALLHDETLCAKLRDGSKSADFPLRLESTNPLSSLDLSTKPSKEAIDKWTSDISTFWSSSAGAQELSRDRKLATIFEHCTNPNNDEENVLRTRFSLTFFDLHNLLYPHTSSKTLEVLAQKILDNNLKKDRNWVLEKLQRLVRHGRRYDKLTKFFGNGILIELPVNMSSSHVMRLPYTDEKKFSDAVQPFVNGKLKEAALTNGSNLLAERIRNSCLGVFQSLADEQAEMNPRKRARKGPSWTKHQTPASEQAFPKPLSPDTEQVFVLMPSDLGNCNRSETYKTKLPPPESCMQGGFLGSRMVPLGFTGSNHSEASQRWLTNDDS